MYIPQICFFSLYLFLFSPSHPHGTVPAPTGQRSERSNVIRRLTGVVLWVRHELTSPNWLAIAAAAFLPILFSDCLFLPTGLKVFTPNVWVNLHNTDVVQFFRKNTMLRSINHCVGGSMPVSFSKT